MIKHDPHRGIPSIYRHHGLLDRPIEHWAKAIKGSVKDDPVLGTRVQLASTGTVFVYGNHFDPTYADMEVIVEKLQKHLWLRKLWKCSLNYSRLVISDPVRLAGEVRLSFESGRFRNSWYTGHGTIKLLLWGYWCYAFSENLTGIRPYLTPAIPLSEMPSYHFRCPICRRKAPLPQIRYNQQKILQEYAKWLYRHARQCRFHRNYSTELHLPKELRGSMGKEDIIEIDLR